MAVVLPVILLVVLGTVEIGMAFKDILTVGALSREGARIAALAGDDGNADCAVLVGIAEIASAGDLSRIDEIQIFEAGLPSGQPINGNVNIAEYNGGDPLSCISYTDITDGWDFTATPYMPGERNTTAGSEPLEVIGVRVILTREWVTGFPPFNGGPYDVDDDTISRVEPEAFDN